MESYASDLNPVAVIINKAMIEIPPKFIGHKPVNSVLSQEKQSNLIDDWSNSKGVAEDVHGYGVWVRNEAKKRIGHLFPKIEVTKKMAEDRPDLTNLVGHQLTVVSWVWARTVPSPNPAFQNIDVPLASTFVLSSHQKGYYIEPIIEDNDYYFKVKCGNPTEAAKHGTKLGRGGHFQCLLSSSPIHVDYVRAEGKAGRMKSRLMAIIAEGSTGKVYLSPSLEQIEISNQIVPSWKPDIDINFNPRDIRSQLYGLTKYSDLFTARQLVALTTFSDLIQDAILKAHNDALIGGMTDDGLGLEQGGSGALAYAQAIGLYLTCTLGRAADYWSSLATWEPGGGFIAHAFTKQAIPMVWDYAEANPFSGGTGNWEQTALAWVIRVILHFNANTLGLSSQQDAATQELTKNKVVSTDPPYYDNIGYADLSDYFYVWMRKTLRSVFPNLFATVVVPKSEELVASPYRHGGKQQAEKFFLNGMSKAIHNLADQAHPAFPVTIYYAFKQSETKEESGTSNTAWETFLEAVLSAGFSICGTWPMRTERANRSVSIGANALASSIVLVCRKRTIEANTISRRQFIKELNSILPEALDEMTRGAINSPVAPVDLSQAIIGPGMAIFSQYSAVLESDGKPMNVRTALQLINRFLAEDDFDHDTQFCLHWFETQGWNDGMFGEAEVLARAKGTSVNALQQADIVKSSAGKFRVLRWREYQTIKSPEFDNRTSVWASLHQLILALNQEGESAAGGLLARIPARAGSIRILAYRLYTLCERKGWAEEARAYNEIINAWTGIEKSSHEVGHSGSQAQLDI